jgi:predicted nucleotidyltransferase
VGTKTGSNFLELWKHMEVQHWRIFTFVQSEFLMTKKEHIIRQTAIKKAKQFLTECEELPFVIDRAILFGSAAAGKATEYSDIDLALFSTKFTDNVLKNIDLIGKINIRFPDIDVHAYPSAHFKQKGLLIEQIKKTGIEIKI